VISSKRVSSRKAKKRSEITPAVNVMSSAWGHHLIGRLRWIDPDMNPQLESLRSSEPSIGNGMRSRVAGAVIDRAFAVSARNSVRHSTKGARSRTVLAVSGRARKWTHAGRLNCGLRKYKLAPLLQLE
jgi:hypothetical protein